MKTIVFDFDGTICDSLPKIIEVINGVLPKYKIRKLNKKDLGFFRKNGLRRSIMATGISLIKIAKINSEARKIMATEEKNLKMFRGINEVLNKLKEKGYILGILTLTSREAIEGFLKKNKIEIFDFIYSGGSVLGKHMVIKKMMKIQKMQKNDFVYVGDEVRDIEACKKVGVKIISVAWGFNDYEVLKKYEPDWLIRKPEELRMVI